ncbi:MAG: hypothetical protein BWY85_00834 [Firmicutes bacterium ADurb.Bin506]|nr:MAG: hypothetical protein BWY85_00834 [Firmicutes bacterium ADurb.Bin506]
MRGKATEVKIAPVTPAAATPSTPDVAAATPSRPARECGGMHLVSTVSQAMCDAPVDMLNAAQAAATIHVTSRGLELPSRAMTGAVAMSSTRPARPTLSSHTFFSFACSTQGAAVAAAISEPMLARAGSSPITVFDAPRRSKNRGSTDAGDIRESASA